jgi:hypothetical protein
LVSSIELWIRIRKKWIRIRNPVIKHTYSTYLRIGKKAISTRCFFVAKIVSPFRDASYTSCLLWLKLATTKR